MSSIHLVEKWQMHDDTSDIQAFYDKNVEKEDGRLERHQIERDI